VEATKLHSKETLVFVQGGTCSEQHVTSSRTGRWEVTETDLAETLLGGRTVAKKKKAAKKAAPKKKAKKAKRKKK
jgi:hypothetical protein